MNLKIDSHKLTITTINQLTIFSMMRFRNVAATVAATVAAATVSVLVYRAYKRVKKPDPPAQLHVEPFENKYFKEYDELPDDPDAPVPRAHVCVRETTPQGDVIMTYDADRAAFCYYCDKRSVQFKYLESVARKYVIAHGCKRLCIDIRKANTLTAAKPNPNPNPNLNPNLNPNPNSNPNSNPNKTASIFAQFKKYTPLKGKTNDALKVKEQVTRYLHCGRLDEYHDEESGEAGEVVHDFNIIKPIDYASYKKMIVIDS